MRSSSPKAAINKTEKARRPAYWYEGGARTMTASNTGHSGFDVSIGYTGMGGNTSGAGGTYADYQTLAVPPSTLFATVRKSEIENSPEAHHDMPVKLGINVRYNVNDRWSSVIGSELQLFVVGHIPKQQSSGEYRQAEAALHKHSVLGKRKPMAQQDFQCLSHRRGRGGKARQGKG